MTVTDWGNMKELDVVFPIQPVVLTKEKCAYRLRDPTIRCFEQSITIVVQEEDVAECARRSVVGAETAETGGGAAAGSDGGGSLGAGR
jgi:hypothetical protein